MLQPRKQKYRKWFKGRIKGVASRGTELAFGDFGLKALASGQIRARQIEAARKAIVHYTRRGGRVWIRIFPDKPVTRKPAETRMGGGKGDVAFYAAPVRAGMILFELGALEEEVAREALRLAANKLPVKTRIVAKD
jgi:large subunit ribosomal protein L16